MVTKNARRLVLALSLVLLPGMAGAADLGPAEHALWEDWTSPAELFARLSESWDELTALWTHGGSVDPYGGGEGTNAGGTIDPNG